VEGQPAQNRLIGFACGFPGLYFTPDGPRPKHCSHMLGVLPDFRRQGIGFALKRAQWQMVRHQGLDLITWTYDPLLSENAFLNIVRLGAVTNTYLREIYGDMRDDLNTGLPSDRFQVDWWVNSQRVQRRLSRRARHPLDLAHFLSAGAEIINSTHIGAHGFAVPDPEKRASLQEAAGEKHSGSLLLVEIPSDFMALKAADPGLALEWRLHARALFESLFSQGYLVVDFVHLPGASSRSFYLLSHEDNTL
jgi:predicted GNAT superfamily acetyltransferase